MRKIKFRAWIIHPESDCEFWEYFEALEGARELDGCAELITCQQYILTNAFNQDVYEGDIVKYLDEVWAWRWDELNTRFTLARKRYKNLDSCAGKDGYIYQMVPPDDKRLLETIGNICENPELLRG